MIPRPDFLIRTGRLWWVGVEVLGGFGVPGVGPRLFGLIIRDDGGIFARAELERPAGDAVKELLVDLADADASYLS